MTIEIKSKYFISSDAQTVSQDSQNRFDKVMNKVIKYHDEDAFVASSVVEHHLSGSLVGGCSLLIGAFIILIIYFIYYKRHELEELIQYDNVNIFSTPFHRNYWQSAIDEVRKMKVFDMCLIALLFALQIVVKIFKIPSGFSNLGLGITFLIFATTCMIYGPIWGLFIGFFSDLLGFFLFPNPTGTTFFIGYSLQAMLSGFVYGFFLYKTDIKFSKTLICRLVINICLNGVLGAFLWGYVTHLNFSATLAYMISVTLPKNIIYLFPQAFILYLFLLLVLPLFEKKNIISKEVIKASIKKK
jgi:ECF transporter S component (folate family)